MFRMYKKKVRLNYKNCFSKLIHIESKLDLNLIILTTNYFTLSQFDKEDEIYRVLITRAKQGQRKEECDILDQEEHLGECLQTVWIVFKLQSDCTGWTSSALWNQSHLLRNKATLLKMFRYFAPIKSHITKMLKRPLRIYVVARNIMG